MDPEASIDEALANFNYGAYVVTAQAGEERDGIFAAWVMQVSFQPRRVAIGVAKGRNLHHLIDSSGTFAVNVLGTRNTDLMARFVAPHQGHGDRFAGTRVESRATGAPVLLNGVGFVECRVVASFDVGDHTLFIGEVVNGDWFQSGQTASLEEMNIKYEYS